MIDPALPEDQLDQAARSANHTSTTTPGVQIRSRYSSVVNRRPRKPQSLQIAFWNANGLTTKKSELEEFVQRHQLDAVHIGKTHLRATGSHYQTSGFIEPTGKTLEKEAPRS
ncbi:hypothetical protein Trydic_g9502 [Trypoxylus dichotomus]